MWRNILCESAYQLAITLFLVYKGGDAFAIDADYTKDFRGDNPGDYIGTFTFNTFVFAQVCPWGWLGGMRTGKCVGLEISEHCGLMGGWVFVTLSVSIAIHCLRFCFVLFSFLAAVQRVQRSLHRQ
jgi:hypothetical protein